MHTLDIELRPRFLNGTDIAKKIRRAGLLPAVVYRNGEAAQSVALDPKPMRKGLQGVYGTNQIFKITLSGETRLALVREFQLHPVKRNLLHVDLMVVEADSPITVTVPVRTVGRSAGEKAGGRVEIITRFVKVRCTPETLPTHIEVNVTPFLGGTTLPVEDLPFPNGVVPVFRRSYKVLRVTMPKLEVEVAEEEAAEPATVAE